MITKCVEALNKRKNLSLKVNPQMAGECSMCASENISLNTIPQMAGESSMCAA